MSRKRAHYLVELSKSSNCQLPTREEIPEMSSGNDERKSSPLPSETETPEFRSLLHYVFDDSSKINECDSWQNNGCTSDKDCESPISHSLTNNKNLILKPDINLNIAGPPSTPMLNSPNFAADINKPSSIAMTPQSVEPLFSVSTDNQNCNEEDCTPVLSPYCDFDDDLSSDKILVPSSHENTLATEQVTSTHDTVSCSPRVNTHRQDIDNLSILESPQTASICSPATLNESDYTDVSTPKNKRRSKKRTDLGLKRLKHQDDWLSKKRQRLYNKGMPYISTRGIKKDARRMKVSCSATCRLRCYEKITDESRKELFSRFWDTGSHVKQWQIIAKYVMQKNKKTATNLEETSRRSYTLHYHLPLHDPVTDSTSSQKVCKTMFLNTFNISKEFVYTALRKNNDCNDFVDIIDDRGRHKNHASIITNEMKQSVIDHVNSFIPVESHYVRKRSNKKYLDSSLSFSKIFKLYAEWCSQNNYNDKVKTIRQYRDTVNTNMKIGFYLPKKDQCDLCHQFKNTSCPTDEQKENFTKHQNEKEFSRKLKLESKMLAISNNKVACIVFDFQKVLSAPHGNISIYYYRRKLNVYNFTIFELASKEAFCYMWDEQIAKRGANEVASCLYDFFSKLVSKGISEVNLWSDNCGGQNRNRIVYYMYLLAANIFKIKICHRFLEKGYTQNEGDSVHALIEKTARGREIYSPDEWYSLVRWAKVNDKPYNVIEVNQDMIFDFKTQTFTYKKWTKNVNQEKVLWNKVKEIVANPGNDGLLEYKYSLGDVEGTKIQCYKRCNTRLTRSEPFPDKSYKSLLKINKLKYKDLKYYCDNNIIPEKYHIFYENLLFGEQTEDVSSDDD
ncbi:hypothetical protein ACJJTC_018955 [Scirpophaga incertulas]